MIFVCTSLRCLRVEQSGCYFAYSVDISSGSWYAAGISQHGVAAVQQRGDMAIITILCPKSNTVLLRFGCFRQFAFSAFMKHLYQ